MYPENVKNQVLKTQNQKIINSSNFDLQKYPLKYPRKKRIVCIYLINKARIDDYRPCNIVIAIECGCSVRTVISVTEEMEADGIFIKIQSHKHARNKYFFHKKIIGKEGFLFRLSVIPPEKFENYKNHAIPPFSSQICTRYEVIYIKREPITPYKEKKTSAKEIGLSPVTNKSKKPIELYKEKHKQLSKGLSMYTQVEKEIGLNQNKKPSTQEVINDPRVKSLVFNNFAQELTSLLKLDIQSQVKLVAYPDSALGYALEFIRPFMTKKKQLTCQVKDRVGWLIGILNRYCTENKLQPQWKWYFRFCEAMGIAHVTKSVARPLNLPSKKETRIVNGKISYVLPSEAVNRNFSPLQEKPTGTMEQQIFELEVDILHSQENIDKIRRGEGDPGALFFQRMMLPSFEQELVSKKEKLLHLQRNQKQHADVIQ